MCIGNTGDDQVTKFKQAVYPYVYREHFLIYLCDFIFDRFIPMCIGNTVEFRADACMIPVYPYVYREHL